MSYCHVKAQSFNVKAGLNYSTIISKDKDGNYSGEYTMKPGFHGGITIDIPLIEFITLESGLILSTKGFKSEVENQSIKVNRNLTSYYMDIPILIKGLHSVKDELEIFGVFGPYLSYGIHGKAWGFTKIGDNQTDLKEDVKWGNDPNEDDLKRMDLGLTFGGGVNIKKIILMISYDLGLSNIASDQSGGLVVNNRVLELTAGYKF